MGESEIPTLRGFDAYEVRLGDELRGHRATLGKSLLDVQRDLRIKASYIDAIENCDASVIPNRGFVPGYVRAYARYLQLDADEVYARFCAESGFKGQGAAAVGRPGAGASLSGVLGARAAAPDPALSGMRIASPIGRARPVGLGVSMSDIASVGVLLALIGGIGYGGWALLQDIQRVDFAPSNDAPELAGTPPAIAVPGMGFDFAEAPLQSAGIDRDAALVELYAPPEIPPPRVALRDGPIAAIDPRTAGFYAERAAAPAAASTAVAVGEDEAAPQVADVSAPEAAAPAAPASAAEGVWVVATAPAWIQVKGRDGSILVQRIFERGDRWQVPDDVERPVMRAGNAGGVYVEVDGTLRGPLGASGAVVKNVSLLGEAVAAAWPAASETAIAAAGAPKARAEAKLDLR